MSDVRMLAALALAALAVGLAARGMRPPTLPGAHVLDTLFGATFAGVVAGRLAAVVLDDPGALGTLREVIQVRSGMELWPGAAVAAGVLPVRAQRDSTPLAPAWPTSRPTPSWPTRSTSCPASGATGASDRPARSVSARPASYIRNSRSVSSLRAPRARLRSPCAGSPRPGVTAVVLAVAATATVRSIASICLRKIGDGPTRQHLESIAVAVTAVVALAVWTAVRRLRRAPASAPTHPTDVVHG